MPKNPQLIPLMQEMATLTRPQCGACDSPFSCCEAMYCETARYFAEKHWGVELVDTGHPTIPFMGEHGCVVAPHLRPLCTLHTCRIRNAGSSGDPAWDRQYFELLAQIEVLDESAVASTASGES